MKKSKSCVRPLLESIFLLDQSKTDPVPAQPVSYGDIQWVRATVDDLLPTVVHAILGGLEEIVGALPKENVMRVLGWTLILSQYEWPRFSQRMRCATERIQKEKTFEYVGLLDYIGESATLEELAWLHNQVKELNKYF